MKLLVLMSRGASPWAQELVESLGAMGHELHLVDFVEMPPGGLPTHEADTAQVEKLFASVELVPGARSSWALAGAVRRAHARLATDLIVCLYGGRFALAAYLARSRPYVVYVVGSDVLLAGRRQRFLNRLMLARAALVFANGANLAEQARLQAPRAHVEMLLLGVDVARFMPRPRPATPRIFSHRTFSPTYNNETTIRALALLPQDVPPFEMVFASGGPDLEAARALAERILPPHIRPRVSFWCGRARREELLVALAESDICVSVALSDGTPTSVLEAMSCGVFPILSDIPANRALVDVVRGIGALVPATDAAALARALEQGLRNVDWHRDIAPQIRAHVGEFADARVNRERLAARLQSVIASMPS